MCVYFICLVDLKKNFKTNNSPKVQNKGKNKI